MVYSHQLQADHCRRPPAWNGIWIDVKGKSWYVEACRAHAAEAEESRDRGLLMPLPQSGIVGHPSREQTPV